MMRSSIVTSTYSGLDIDYSITTIDCGDEIKAPRERRNNNLRNDWRT